VTQPIHGTGTGEQTWLTWRRLDAFPSLPLDACLTALVVAPHPDDEVLGVGGALCELRARGAAISVLALTNGEASHPAAVIDPLVLAECRVAESERALQVLVGGCSIERLGLPDGGLAGCEDEIREAAEARLDRGSWCFAPALEDGHPDHEAAARAARLACSRRRARLIEYPIWLWHWGAPRDPRIPWTRARRIDLSPAARERKSRAIGAYASQIAPLSGEPGGEAILPPSVLERFTRAAEVVFA
jgi:LmbE family N-acetylglucosaminyl deacetylase